MAGADIGWASEKQPPICYKYYKYIVSPGRQFYNMCPISVSNAVYVCTVVSLFCRKSTLLVATYTLVTFFKMMAVKFDIT